MKRCLLLMFLYIYLVQAVIAATTADQHVESSHKNGSHSIIRAIEKTRQKIQIEQAHGFQFENGYRDSSESSLSVQNFLASLLNKSSHSCSDTPKLVGLHYRVAASDTARSNTTTANEEITFQGRTFLRVLSRRTLWIIGDSLGFQLFQALDLELHPFLSAASEEILVQSSASATNHNNHNNNHKGNSSRGSPLRTHSHHLGLLGVGNNNNSSSPSLHAPSTTSSSSSSSKQQQQQSQQGNILHRRVYSAYNTTIVFCKSIQISADDACISRLSSPSLVPAGSVLLISHGILHKPSGSNAAGGVGGSYHTRLEEATQRFQKSVVTLRQYIQSLRNRLYVVWRLVPHVGPIDELLAAGQSSVPDFKDGSAWNDPSMDAEWVYDFNVVLRAVSQLYGDAVLDLHTLSLQLLRHVSVSDQSSNSRGGGGGGGGGAGGGGGGGGGASMMTAQSTGSSSSTLQVHSDAMHYCAGGLFRASALLLSHLLRSILPTH